MPRPRRRQRRATPRGMIRSPNVPSLRSGFPLTSVLSPAGGEGRVRGPHYLSLRQFHVGDRVHREGGALAGQETRVTGRGDHRGVVGAEGRRGAEELPPALGDLRLERAPEGLV